MVTQFYKQDFRFKSFITTEWKNQFKEGFYDFLFL